MKPDTTGNLLLSDTILYVRVHCTCNSFRELNILKGVCSIGVPCALCYCYHPAALREIHMLKCRKCVQHPIDFLHLLRWAEKGLLSAKHLHARQYSLSGGCTSNSS